MATRSTNEVHLVGRAGKDAEVKYTPNGKALTKFSLATGGGKKKSGEGDWPTDWHQIVAWGEQLAEMAPDITKGSVVEVTGRIQYGSYEKDGRKVYTTDIVANQITLPDSEHNEAPKELPVHQLRDDFEITDSDMDAIPF